MFKNGYEGGALLRCQVRIFLNWPWQWGQPGALVVGTGSRKKVLVGDCPRLGGE